MPYDCIDCNDCIPVGLSTPCSLAKPHAHVMLSMREVDLSGEGSFGKKVREWTSTELLTDWRERWAEHVNERPAEL